MSSKTQTNKQTNRSNRVHWKPGIDGEGPGLGTVHQLAEELLSRRRVMPQQGLVRKGFLDLARHPVVGVNHTLSHCLVDLQGLTRDQGCDVLLLVQLGSHLGRKET